jgi:HD-like signal output (HDOD) protein
MRIMDLFKFFRRTRQDTAGAGDGHAQPVLRAAPSREPHAPPRAAEPAPAPAVLAPLAARPAPMPAALAGFKPVHSQQMDPAGRAIIVEVFRDVPRPPRLLHRLLSPGFVSNASSAELADLIVAEPLIAAKLLATINSPLYALRSPIHSVDQAVTLLGLTSVRSLCLRYLMMNSFRADSAERQRVLDTTWRASALACELTHRLALGLGMPEHGALVSQVVLSFLGRLATAATMPHALLTRIPQRGLLARAVAEQEALGLTAGEIGRLLMADWGLPEPVASDAADIDTVLHQPFRSFEPVHASRLALCYLAARLGERLAGDPQADLQSFDLHGDPDPEWHHLRGYLQHPALMLLDEQLKAKPLLEAIERMRQSLSQPAPGAAKRATPEPLPS